ncbi:MAG: hypothetical protein K1X68_05335 [Saprospiraceae bacterium]|nr:hypothetical protein [Saprospiraceae bacterium]HNL05802.1 hypothetical protein [Bacteroidia bacterium]
MEVLLKVSTLVLLVIIIEGSSCHNRYGLQNSKLPEMYLAFIAFRDTIIIESKSFEILSSINDSLIPSPLFKIKILDTSYIKAIKKMNRPNILLKSIMTEAYGKPIHYSSSIEPPNSDFFYLLEKGSNTQIGIDSINEILCWKMKARIEYFIQDTNDIEEYK